MARIKKIPSAKSDAELLLAYRQHGDQNDVAVLFSRYVDLVYGVCLKYFKSTHHAQDGVMAIFEQLLQKLRVHNVEDFKSWLYRVTCNFCLMELRKGKRHPQTVEIDESIMHFEDFVHPNQKEQNLTLMEQCLETLPVAQKEAIHLFYMKEKCYREIAAIVGAEINQVRSFIQNGRRNLKICLEKKMQQEK